MFTHKLQITRHDMCFCCKLQQFCCSLARFSPALRSIAKNAAQANRNVEGLLKAPLAATLWLMFDRGAHELRWKGQFWTQTTLGLIPNPPCWQKNLSHFLNNCISRFKNNDWKSMFMLTKYYLFLLKYFSLSGQIIINSFPCHDKLAICRIWNVYLIVRQLFLIKF
jgi:hypothetical protein